ncbi:MAG: ThuA domain-containing protein [Spirochaetes bacterium]|nr:ThuA domain-containing protein [Spirochaetota bacterium]
MAKKIRVTVWNEFRHEKESAAIAKIYPDGMHVAIAAGLRKDPQFEVRTATLDEKEHGLTQKVLADTDVLTWWGHMAHGEVKDEIIDRAQQRIIEGMGLIVLHSGHYSKMFKRMMGTSCALRWREANEKARLWVVEPGHPIADGLPAYFELPHEEMYGERFDIPNPDAVVFISWFAGGNVFRSGCTFTRGKGRIFYFQPGHETYPNYFDPNVQRVIANAARWAAPGDGPVMKLGDSEPPLEKL